MDESNPWLTRSNAEFVAGWMEAWWIEARSHAEIERVGRQLLDASDPVQFAMIDLVDHDPARALEVAFLIGRAADHPGMMIDVGVSILQEVLKQDPTLWDAIALEAASNPRLLDAVGQVWECEVPDALRLAYQNLVQRDDTEGQSQP